MTAPGRQPRFPIVAASCLWKCKAFDANGSLRASLRTHTIGRRLPVGAGASKQPFADLPIFSIVCFGRILGTAAPGQEPPRNEVADSGRSIALSTQSGQLAATVEQPGSAPVAMSGPSGLAR